MIDISIIIPHYNNWEMLRELLETIPTDDRIEVIVVDDHSSESNNQIEEQFPQVFFLSNKLDKKGAGAARNVGLKKATGKWLLFADSDDLFITDFIKKIEKYIISDMDIIFFSPSSFTIDGSKKSNRHSSYEKYVRKYIENPSEDNELRLRYLFYVPWSKLIKRELVKENKIKFEEISVSNDILFSAKIGKFAKKISADDQVIYSVREREGSLTTLVNPSRFKQRLDAYIEYVAFIKKHNTRKEIKILNLTLMPFLLAIWKNKLPLSSVHLVFKKMIEFKIPILSVKSLVHFIKRLATSIKRTLSFKKND